MKKQSKSKSNGGATSPSQGGSFAKNLRQGGMPSAQPRSNYTKGLNPAGRKGAPGASRVK